MNILADVGDFVFDGFGGSSYFDDVTNGFAEHGLADWRFITNFTA
jgi:hypothetical protein